MSTSLDSMVIVARPLHPDVLLIATTLYNCPPLKSFATLSVKFAARVPVASVVSVPTYHSQVKSVTTPPTTLAVNSPLGPVPLQSVSNAVMPTSTVGSTVLSIISTWIASLMQSVLLSIA